MRTFVVPDLHGKYLLALGLMRSAELVDEHGLRVQSDVQVVQLGDLANCVSADRDGDLRLLRIAKSWFDVLLVGNHEHPYFGGPRFSGFFEIPEVKEAVKALEWRAAWPVGSALLTHAGVTPRAAERFPLLDALAFAGALNALWENSPTDGIFSAIGYSRGGRAPTGGVLWSDFVNEPRSGRWNQVHGHTPIAEGPIRNDVGSRWSLNLDCGGKGGKRAVGVWLDEDGDVEKLVECNLTGGHSAEEAT